MELLIVTGLSGAGKSQAIHTLEDIGYFCFDNIPAELLLDFLERCRKAGRAGRFAAVLDVRSNAYSGDVGESVQTLAEAGYAVKVLFLDAADDVLLRRYKETRRPHPLIHGEVIRWRRLWWWSGSFWRPVPPNMPTTCSTPRI